MTLLRSALFNLVFFAVTGLLSLAATVARLVAPGYVIAVAMLWARVLIAAVRIICGIRLDVTGLEHVPPGAVLIASRHQSAFDTFVWLALLPHCCYVAKQELLRIPLFGALIRASGMIIVDRAAGGAAIRSLLRQADQAAQAKRQIVIFPEGTRGEPDHPGILQSGVAALASYTGLPVVPVSTNSGRFWGRRAFRKRPGTIRIVIGQQIEPRLQRKAFMQALEEGLAVADSEIRDRPSASA